MAVQSPIPLPVDLQALIFRYVGCTDEPFIGAYKDPSLERVAKLADRQIRMTREELPSAHQRRLKLIPDAQNIDENLHSEIRLNTWKLKVEPEKMTLMQREIVLKDIDEREEIGLRQLIWLFQSRNPQLQPFLFDQNPHWSDRVNDFLVENKDKIVPLDLTLRDVIQLKSVPREAMNLPFLPHQWYLLINHAVGRHLSNGEFVKRFMDDFVHDPDKFEDLGPRFMNAVERLVYGFLQINDPNLEILQLLTIPFSDAKLEALSKRNFIWQKFKVSLSFWNSQKHKQMFANELTRRQKLNTA